MMELKNDCERDYIKEAFDKLYNSVMPFVDLTQFDDAASAFKDLDKKVHSEIYILKKCLAERDRAVDSGLTRSEVLQERISDMSADLLEANNRIEALRRENDSLRVTTFDTIDEKEKEINALKKKIHELYEENANLRITPPDVNAIEALEKENSELKTSNERLNTKYKSYWKALSETKADVTRYKMDNIRLRKVIDGRDNEIHELEKKIQDLEEENASLTEDVDALVAENTDLHARLSDDAIRIKSLERANSVLRRDNGILWSKMEECDLDIFKRPWHGDGNAMTGAQTCYKSLVETIEFQSKKIEELEAEKARLKEAYDIHETTIKKENVDLSYGHEFEFGDEVFVPWSCDPYMYIKSGMMYNPRTERLVYVGKDQHLKWFGDKFSIV